MSEMRMILRFSTMPSMSTIRRRYKSWHRKNHKGFYARLTDKELDDRARENVRKYLITIRRFLMWVGRSDLATKFGHSEWKREYALIDYISIEEWQKIEASELFTPEEKLLLKLHITLGCREGHKERSGLSGLRWSKINWKSNTIDVYESKVKGGLIWQGCSLTLFWPDIPAQLKKRMLNGERLRFHC